MRDTTRLLTKGNKQRRLIDDDQSSQLSTALSIESTEQPLTSWPTRRKMQELKKQRCKTNTLHICWFLLGLFLMIGTLQMLWAPTYLENVVHGGIADAFIFTDVRPDDENYDKWVTNDHGEDSIPIKVSLQFFNLTNPEDLTNGLLDESQRIPKFELSPPIVYTQYFYRENISFSSDGTMSRSYFKTRFFHDEQASEIGEDDVFTIIAPLVAAGKHFYEKNAESSGLTAKFLYNGFFEWLDSNPLNNLLSTATAHDLIFNILDFQFPQNETFIPPLGPTVSAGSMIDFKYGLLKNGSGSWYVSHTGYGDERRMGEVLKWSNQPQDFQPSESDPVLINFDDDNFSYIDCWYPNLPYSPAHFIYQGVWNIMEDENNLPPFFVSTLKRPLVFDYYKAMKYKNIPAQQYNISTGRQFMNESQYPPNVQFYQFGPSGVMNMTSCFNDLPLFFSLPHFYGAPDFAANNSKLGISEPVTDRDFGGFLQVEPMSGAVLNAQVSLQGNVPLGPLPNYGANITANQPSLTYLPEGIMAPTYLLRYEAHLPDKGAKMMAKQLKLADNLDHGFYYFGYVCLGLAVIYWSYTMYWIGQNGAKKMFPGLCCPLKTQMQLAQV